MEVLENKVFWLFVILIAVVYFTGVYTDAAAFTQAFTQVSYALTGRNSSGNFASYPSGANQVTPAFH